MCWKDWLVNLLDFMHLFVLCILTILDNGALGVFSSSFWTWNYHCLAILFLNKVVTEPQFGYVQCIFEKLTQVNKYSVQFSFLDEPLLQKGSSVLLLVLHTDQYNYSDSSLGTTSFHFLRLCSYFLGEIYSILAVSPASSRILLSKKERSRVHRPHAGVFLNLGVFCPSLSIWS